MSTDPDERACTYSIRVRNEDGSERVIVKTCPFLAVCREQGHSCLLPEPGEPA